MEANGWIIIGTKLEAKQLEKDLNNQKRKLEQYEKEAEKLATTKVKLEEDLSSYREELALIQETTDEFLKQAQTKEEVDNLLKLEQEEINNLNQKYSAQFEQLDNINLKIQENAKNQALVASEIEKTTNKLKKLKGFNDIKNSIDGIGKSMKQTIKQVGRWALAVFGIRSAYMAVRNAMNVIAQNDKQLAADIQYMKNILAYTLEPVVRSIVNSLKQILYYVGYITQEWFGKNIFTDANEKLKKANKNAQKLSKTLAGFDEMNVVGSNASNDTPNASFDLSGKIDDTDMENTWIGWIAKNGDKVAAAIGTITGALIVMRVFGINPILALGIAAAITGIIWLIEDIIDMIEDPSWDKFGDIMADLTLILLGVAAALIFLNASNPLGWIVLAMALVAALAALIIKNWNKIKETFQKVKDWIKSKFIDPIKGWFNGLPKWAQTLVKGIANIFITALNGIITGINGFLLPFSLIIAGLGAILGKKWKWNFLQIPRIPYLAKGGIVNLPSRGVPVGGAMAGERGAEGVIPLTDSQQMALLGEAIGKYITINATVVNSMNGRVLSREIQKIQNQSDFAMNR